MAHALDAKPKGPKPRGAPASNLHVRVTRAERDRIENNARACGLTVSEYVRRRALREST